MSLTELSNYVRKAIPFVVLFGLVFLIIYYSFKLAMLFFEQKEVPSVYTNLVFGKIDPPTIKEVTNSADFTFKLDNVEGSAVTATSTANIYFLPEAPTRFGYREKIMLMAKTFGFDTAKTNYVLEDKLASFFEDGKRLLVNIGSFNFTFERPIKNEDFVAGSITISKSEIVNRAISFLKSTGRYPDELSKGSTNVIYLKFDSEANDFINVEKPEDASVVEVDFFRPDVNGFPVATPKFFNSQNYVIMNFPNEEVNVIRAQISFFEKSSEQYGVYPLKTGDLAWEQLKSGQGKVIAGQSGIKNITIKKMGLYYLDPDVYQTYLQPVYVFMGDFDFVAYVPAVTDSYTTK